VYCNTVSVNFQRFTTNTQTWSFFRAAKTASMAAVIFSDAKFIIRTECSVVRNFVGTIVNGIPALACQTWIL